MPLSYKIDGEDPRPLAFNLSSKTEEVKAYITEEHTVTIAYTLRFYVNRKQMTSKAGKTLEECGVGADSCLSVHYCTSAAKQRERRLAAKAVEEQLQPTITKIDNLHDVLVLGGLPVKPEGQSDEQRLRLVQQKKQSLTQEEKELKDREKKRKYNEMQSAAASSSAAQQHAAGFDPSLSPEENRAKMKARHADERKMMTQRLKDQKKNKTKPQEDATNIASPQEPSAVPESTKMIQEQSDEESSPANDEQKWCPGVSFHSSSGEKAESEEEEESDCEGKNNEMCGGVESENEKEESDCEGKDNQEEDFLKFKSLRIIT